MKTPWQILRRGMSSIVVLLVVVALGLIIAISSGLYRPASNAGSLAHATKVAAYPAPATAGVAKPASGEAAYPPPEKPEPPALDSPYTVISAGSERTWDEESLLQSSPIIVYARVAEVQPARWSTPDGQRPKNPFDNLAFIYTPVKLDVIELLKGKPQQSLMINATGGVIGKDSVKRLPVEENTFEVGQQVVLYFPDPTLYGKRIVHGFNKRYTVTPGGQAENEMESVPLDELLASIRKAVSKQ